MKKSLKYLCIAILTFACVVCLVIAGACANPEPDPKDPSGSHTPEDPGTDPGTDPGGSTDPGKDPETPPEEKETYTVTFNMNGYGVAVAPASAKEGESVTEPQAPKALYATFGGWYTDADCKTAFNFSAPLTANVTVYAKWTPTGEYSGYAPDDPRHLVLDDVEMVADDIASGTTLYYTYTAAEDGRYVLSFGNAAANKVDYTYNVVRGDESELKTVVSGTSVYFSLAKGQTVNVEAKLKDGEVVPVEKPTYLLVTISTVTDEPVPDGEFLEGIYTGVCSAGEIYFKITDRTAKTFTMSIGSAGVTVRTFSYVDGVLKINTASDWAEGTGTMVWTDGQIEFTSSSSKYTATLTKYVAISLDHEKWIGEYECDDAEYSVKSILIGREYAQLVKESGVSTYFVGSSSSNYATFNNDVVQLAADGKIVIVEQENGRAAKIKYTAGTTVKTFTLKNEQVKEVPLNIPVVEGVTYKSTSGSSKTISVSGNYVLLDSSIINVLDFDGANTYLVKAGNSTYNIKYYYDGKAIEKLELYSGTSLVSTLAPSVPDIANNVYDLVAGANSGAVNGKTKYAYFKAGESKAYTFTGEGGLAVYAGVSVSSPASSGSWKLLENGVPFNIDAGALIAVKQGDEQTVSFNVAVSEKIGSSPESAIKIYATYKFDGPVSKNDEYYFKFIASAAGDYTFTMDKGISSKGYPYTSYIGFCINGVWYNADENGDATTVAKSCRIKLEAGGEVVIRILHKGSFGAESNVNLRVEVAYDFSGASELAFDENYEGSAAAGVYKVTGLPDDAASLKFTSNETITLIRNGASQTGKTVSITKAQAAEGFIIICNGTVSYSTEWIEGTQKKPYSVSNLGSKGGIAEIGGGTYVQFKAPEAATYSFGVSTGWVVKEGDAEAANKISLALGKNEVITLVLTRNSGAATATLTVAYDFVTGATELTIAEDGEQAVAADATYVVKAIAADVASVTFTSASDAEFTMTFSDGTSVKSSDKSYKFTVNANSAKLKAGVAFRLSGAAVNWTVEYKQGTEKNPYELGAADADKVSSFGFVNCSEIYVKITAPEYSDVLIGGAWAKATTYERYPRFKVAGTENYYGYSSATSNNSTYPAFYTLAKGQTVTVVMDYAGNAVSTINLGVWYSGAASNVQQLDFAAENKTLSAESNRVYGVMPDVESITLTANGAFTVTKVAEMSAVQSASEKVAATATDGVYSVTINYACFHVNFGGDTTAVNYAIAAYSTGTEQKPLKCTTLGGVDIPYTSKFSGGKYFLTVTVQEAGSYELSAEEGFMLVGEGLENGVATFAAGELSKTFFVISNGYTPDGEEINKTVSVSIVKHLGAAELTFSNAEGLWGEGTLALENGKSYTVGNVLVSEDNDKHIASITFTGTAAFSVTYSDNVTASAKSLGGVYKLTVTVADAAKKFVLNAPDAEVEYAIDWALGSHLNPVEINEFLSGKTVSYTAENVVYLKVTNDSKYDWLLSVGDASHTPAIVETSTPSGKAAGGVVIPAGQQATVTVTNGASGAKTVNTKISVVYNFMATAAVLGFDVNGTGTTEITSGLAYVAPATIISAEADVDVSAILIKSSGAVKVLLTNGTALEGNREVSLTLEQAKNGFTVECPNAINFEVAWAEASSRNPFVLGLGARQVPYKQNRTSYAKFTATKAGFYKFDVTSDFNFTIDGGAAINGKIEIELEENQEIALTFEANKSTARTSIVVTLTYSATSTAINFTDEQKGVYTGVFTKTVYSWVMNYDLKLEICDGGIVKFSINDGNTAHVEFEPNLTNGVYSSESYTDVYGNAYGPVKFKFENGKVLVSDNTLTNVDGEVKFAELSKEGSGEDGGETESGFTAAQKGTYKAYRYGANYAIFTIEIGDDNEVTYTVSTYVDDDLVNVVDAVKITMTRVSADEFTGAYTYNGAEVTLTITGSSALSFSDSQFGMTDYPINKIA